MVFLTATETLLPPPAIPADALEPLFDDRERVCELVKPDGERCSRAATWIVSGRCDSCTTLRTALLCDVCQLSLVLNRVHHRPCGTAMSTVRVEPL